MRSNFKMILTLGFLVSIPLLLSTLYASAQSFSCAQAENSAEFAICNNEVLISLDEKLAAIYYMQKSKMSTTPQRQKISRDQSAWVQKRNQCSLDWACLEVLYEERLGQLNLKL